MNQMKTVCFRIFQLMFSVSMFMILLVALTKPLHNLIPGRMVFYTAFWILFLGISWWLACKVEQKCRGKYDKVLHYILGGYLLLYGIALFFVSCQLRSDVMTDYQSVYETALQLAGGETEINWDYFARWQNNVGCMLVLTLGFLLGRVFPESVDVYYFVLILNVFQVLLVITCLYYLAGVAVKRHVFAARCTMLIVCGLWIPFWANSSIFYSDQLSLGAAVFGITLLVRGRKRLKIVYFILSGVVLALGAIIKVTSATAFIALLITAFLFCKMEENKRILPVVLLSFFITLAAFVFLCRWMPYQKDSYRLKVPVEYWFALGLGEDGTYAGSEEFAIRCITAENIDARRIIAREQIAEHIDQLWDVKHIVSKVRQNFGCGDLGAARYLLYKDEPNLLWNLFSQEGEYFWKYACVTTSLFFGVLFWLGAGGLVSFIVCRKPKREDFLFFVARLAFWGLCLFLMLWEAQNKQLYNHTGWVLLALVCSLNQVSEMVEGRSK